MWLGRERGWDSEMFELLQDLWAEVVPLKSADVTLFLDRFMAERLRSDFRKKFVREFDGPKPITARFFNGCRVLSKDVRFAELFDQYSGNVSATVLWGPLNSPKAFQLKGAGDGLGDILVADGDACVAIIHRLRSFDLFYDSSREVVYELH